MKKEEVKNCLHLLEEEAKSENIDLYACEEFANEWRIFYEGKFVMSHIRTCEIVSAFDLAYRMVRRVKGMDNAISE